MPLPDHTGRETGEIISQQPRTGICSTDGLLFRKIARSSQNYNNGIVLQLYGPGDIGSISFTTHRRRDNKDVLHV